MRFFSWLDKNLWAVPTLIFVLAETVLLIWFRATPHALFLSSLTPAARQPVYASLTGTASSLLGFTIASVAILAAFSPRTPKTESAAKSERRVAKARDRLVASLLVTAAFFLVLLIVATLGIATDTRRIGNPLVNVLILGSSAASFSGLLVSGAGVALAVIERNRSAA